MLCVGAIEKGKKIQGRTKNHDFLFSGEWSSPPPHCSPVRCPALEILDPHLRVLALNNSYQVILQLHRRQPSTVKGFI